MPLHNGHVLVVDTAVAQCERVTVCLMSRHDEPIAGAVRVAWLQELYGEKCTIVQHAADLPQDDSGYGHWDEYLASIRAVCVDDYDAVFSSEEYGARLADDLGASHVLVDAARTTVPVSGTVIRANPNEHSAYLPAIVREYYETLERNI